MIHNRGFAPDRDPAIARIVAGFTRTAAKQAAQSAVMAVTEQRQTMKLK